MIHCRTVPCLVSDQTMNGWIARQSAWRGARFQVFEKVSGATEMARITASYAGRLGADRIKVVQCGRYGWVRLTAKGKTSDLLFDLESLHQGGLADAVEPLSAAV